MKIIVWGCLIAQMKRFDALITTQKTPALCEVPFLKKIKKNCIKTLHLSYQTPPYDDFHFSTYNGFLEIFRPLVGGVKNQF